MKPDPLIPRRSFPAEVKEDNPRGNQLIQLYLERQPLNGSGSKTGCMLSVGEERWTSLAVDKRRCHVMHLMDLTEVSDRETRMRAVRALLYLCQG